MQLCNGARKAKTEGNLVTRVSRIPLRGRFALVAACTLLGSQALADIEALAVGFIEPDGDVYLSGVTFNTSPNDGFLVSSIGVKVSFVGPDYHQNEEWQDVPLPPNVLYVLEDYAEIDNPARGIHYVSSFHRWVQAGTTHVESRFKDVTVLPPWCSVYNPSTVAMSLTGITTEEIEGCGSKLARTETIEGDDVPFIKEEWAVLQHRGGSLMSTENASTNQFALQKTGCFRSGTLDTVMISGQAADTFLIIDHAPHPPNHRFMPHPHISFTPTTIEADSTTVRGFFRMDVADTGVVRSRELLYTDGDVPTGVLQVIETAMRIEYIDERRHRMVLYGLFEYQSGTLQVLQQQVTLPRCCGFPDPPCVGFWCQIN